MLKECKLVFLFVYARVQIISRTSVAGGVFTGNI